MKNSYETKPCKAVTGNISSARILDSVLDLVCVFDAQGHFMHVNQASFELLGYHPHEIIGRSYKAFVVLQDLKKTIHSFQQLVAGNYTTDFDNRYSHKDGRTIHLAWSGKWDPKDQLVYCTARDISKKSEKEVLCALYEQEVKRQRAEKQKVLERITDGFFTMDAAWRITYINPQVETILSLQREDYLYRNYWDRFPEMVGSIYYEQYHRAVREKRPVHFEAYFPPFEKWLEVSAYPSENELTVFFRDVTEKRRVEEELRTLSLIAKETVNMVAITTPDGKITWINEGFTRITGYSIGEVVGKSPWELFVGPETDPGTLLYIREQQQKGAPFQVEKLNYKKNGDRMWAQVFGQPLYDTTGNLQQYFFIAADITQRKNAEEKLRKLSHVVTQSRNMVTTTSVEGMITWVNQAFVSQTGFTPEEAAGKKLGDLLDGPETNPELVRYMEAQMAKGEVFIVEMVRYTRTKQKFWTEVYGQPVRDEAGTVTRFFVIHTDITERKQLQRQLDEETRQRQQLVTAAIISAQEKERSLISKELHDNVNQLLSSAKLYARLGRDGAGAPAQMMEKTIELLQNAIDEIRKLSKRLSVCFVEKAALEGAVRELVEVVSTANSLPITLHTELFSQELEHTEVKLAVYRILQEHLTNVTKHAGATRVNVTLQQSADHLTLTVVDDGKGFDTRKQAEGIGLTNMRSRAESLKGVFNVDSQPGGGCTLFVQLPLTA